MNPQTIQKMIFFTALTILTQISMLGAPAVKVDFTGGSSISGEVISWNGEKGVIKCDLGEISLDKTKITAESLTRIEDAIGNAKPVELMLKNGSLVSGKILSWDGSAVVIEADVGKVTIPVEKLSDESTAKVNSFPKTKPIPTPSSDSSPGNITATNSASDYKALSKFIVIVEGDRSVGTGFLAQYEGKIYLFTNLHVLDGNKSIKCKTMDGKELLLGGLLASTEYDLAAIELPQEKQGLELQQHVDTTVTLGDEVFVFGNSFGGGVATDLTGKVLAVGPQVLETDVKFVSGNSGSPIISKQSHKVLGIATQSRINKANDFGKDSKFNNVERRFAYRTDNNPGWQQMSLGQFVNETLFMKKLEARTDALWDVAHDIAQNNKVTKSSYKNEWDGKVDELLSPYLQKVSEFQRGVGSSWGDFKNIHQSLLRDLSRACASDLNLNYQFSNWHQRNGEVTLELIQKVRQMLNEFFVKKQADVK
jgi:hypothetical protein